MTELNQKNREIYLDLCKNIWDMDEESMKYLEERTSENWEPVPELKKLINNDKAIYEDQRLRFDMDMSNPDIQSFFSSEDKAYDLFKSYFKFAIEYANEKYNTVIGYKEFIDNKVVFKKNTMKIKKVFELIYAEAEKSELYERDSGRHYSKEDCANWIVKKFENIGASKKSAKKLQFVISFNPIDWLLASTSEKFTSCFNLNYSSDGGGYQYCLGIPFLSGDRNRMMLYITSGLQKEFMGIKVDSVQTRTWCILDKSGSMNIVKWYPNDTVGTSPVVAITGNNNFQNRNSFSEGKYPIDILSTKKGAVISPYHDMGSWKVRDNQLIHKGNDKGAQQFYTKNLLNAQNYHNISFKFNTMWIPQMGKSQPGYNIRLWAKYGLHIDMMFPTARCHSCKEDKAGFSLPDGTYLCYECYKDQVFTCGCCGTNTFKEDGYITVETSDGNVISLCKACAENINEKLCNCCGKFFNELETTKEGEKICPVCLNKGKYFRCEECNKITKNIKFTYNTLTKICTKTCCDCASTNSSVYSSKFNKPYRLIVRENANVNTTE